MSAMTEILLETQTVPQTGRLMVSVHREVQINISAAEAQNRVTQFVHRKISSQMHGEAPTLILGGRTCWRVPVHLTFPSFGDVGRVGVLDVDVESGELQINTTIIQEIERYAKDIARRITPTATR